MSPEPTTERRSLFDQTAAFIPGLGEIPGNDIGGWPPVHRSAEGARGVGQSQSQAPTARWGWRDNQRSGEFAKDRGYSR